MFTNYQITWKNNGIVAMSLLNFKQSRNQIEEDFHAFTHNLFLPPRGGGDCESSCNGYELFT